MPGKHPLFDSYKKFRKQGKVPSEAHRLAKRFEGMKELKRRFPFSSAEADYNARERQVLTNLQEGLEQGFQKRLGPSVKMDPFEARIVIELATTYFGPEFRKTSAIRTFFHQFVPTYVKFRTSKEGGEPGKPNFLKINKAIRGIITAITGEEPSKISRREFDDILFLGRNRSVPELAEMDDVISRARNELKSRDPQTQRRIIDVFIRSWLIKTDVDKHLLSRGETPKQAAEQYLRDTVANFDAKPKSVKERLLQEALSNHRGVIGVVLLKQILEQMIPKYRKRLEQYRQLKAPEFLVNREINQLANATLLKQIFDKPENVRYAQREIAHLWD